MTKINYIKTVKRDAGIMKDYYFESNLLLKYFIKRDNMLGHTTYFRHPFENIRKSTKKEADCREYYYDQD